MPLLGAHMSIAGGYYKAVEAAAKCEMQVVQLFTKNFRISGGLLGGFWYWINATPWATVHFTSYVVHPIAADSNVAGLRFFFVHIIVQAQDWAIIRIRVDCIENRSMQ